MKYIVVKGVPNDYCHCLTIGNILGIFEDREKAVTYTKHLNKNMASSIFILDVLDDYDIQNMVLKGEIKYE